MKKVTVGKSKGIADADQSAIHVVMHRLLTELRFTKCDDEKYRRCTIHDDMYIKLDEWGYMYVFAELDMKNIKIPITCIEPKDKDKFKDWLLFTYGE